MKTDVKAFRVPPGRRIKLKRWPTKVRPVYSSKDDAARLHARHIEQLSSLQGSLYAEGRHALLIIFQAMDAAGKDGAIKHVMSGVNPQGCQVSSFKAPSSEELAHDFLWRTTCRLPARGHIGIFNRSYYEEVLVLRVHPEFLEKQRLPLAERQSPELWKHRYHSIREFEKHLSRNGTKVIKIFLHLSKEEQRRRFLSRIDEPEKNWKISPDDFRERQHWKEYMQAYEACLEETSDDRAPWYCVPADDKVNARLIISQIIIDAMKSLKIQPPELGPDQKKNAQAVRRALVAEK